MCGHGRFVAVIVIGLIGVLGANARVAAQDSAPPSSTADPNAPVPMPPGPSSQTPPATDPTPAPVAPSEAPAAAPTPSPAPPQAVTPPPAPPEKAPAAVKVLERAEIQGVLGREVRSKTGENMGRIVEVIVDRTTGQARAAIIDFGGFLGVGSRKIAVAWNALQFATDQNSERITLELTRDQVKDAPDYKEGRPILALTSSGHPETIPYER
jgi:pyruvate/2-oxoglutarate dehydrogenase complex dihydrolipoamide acyltransferase (E2) component